MDGRSKQVSLYMYLLTVLHDAFSAFGLKKTVLFSDQWKIEGKRSVEGQGSYLKLVDLAKMTWAECERACNIEMDCQSAVFVNELCYLYVAGEMMVRDGKNDSSVLFTKVPRLGK